MINNKNKNKETVKDEKKEKPEVNRSARFNSESPKEKQAPDKFSHKSSKEETYEPKKNEVPRSKI